MSYGGVTPAPAAKATTSGYQGITAPTPLEKQTAETQVAKAQSDYANSFGGIAMNTIKGLWDASGIPQQWQSGQEQIDQPFIQKGQQGGKLTPAQIAEGVLSATSGTVTKIFAPLAPIFNVLTKGIDLAGNAPAIVNNPEIQKFANSPAGSLTSRLAEDVANASNISLTALGGIEGLKATLRGERPLPPEATTEAPSAAPDSGAAPDITPAPKTLAQTHADYAKSMGYEPYVPDAELPVIQLGKPAEDGLPVIQADAPVARPVKGDLTIEPIVDKPIVEAVAKEKTPVVAPPAADAVPKPKTDVPYSQEQLLEGKPAPLKPAESAGEARVSKLASKVDANAVARKLTGTLGDLPQYNKVSMKEQAEFATHMLENEPDRAMRIAMGEELPPHHILPESIFTAVEEKATKAGDIETLRKLATQSNMSTQATAMGQRIRALGERDNLSPVGKIQEVAKARVADAEKRSPGVYEKTKKTIADEITKEIKKGASSKRPTWEEFAKEIACAY